ncbi:MAG: hypothetical protein GEV13_04350 [Rhodospirillales bacterium]|nr:hypothetical protein [Rhodospirillales bacterium]
MRLAWATLPIVLFATSTVQAQPTNEQLAARCSELGAIFDKYGTRRSEGSGGPDRIRLGAGIDCQKGRYAQGIKALEDLLSRNRIPYPPAPY